jgi:hypothetical protein
MRVLAAPSRVVLASCDCVLTALKKWLGHAAADFLAIIVEFYADQLENHAPFPLRKKPVDPFWID